MIYYSTTLSLLWLVFIQFFYLSMLCVIRVSMELDFEMMVLLCYLTFTAF